MTRRTITIIAAIAAVPLLIGGYFGAQAWIKAHPKPSPWNFSDYPESPRLTDFDSSKLSRIENIGEGFALVRNEGNWVLASATVPVDKVKIEQSMISGKLWSLSSIWAESVIDENPADLSLFGLDNPSGRVLIGDSDGKNVEIIFGNYTPSRTSYYIMLAGEPKVYTLSSYSSDMLRFSLDSIRDKGLMMYLDPRELSRFILEPRPEDNPGWEGRIDISPKDDSDYLVTAFTSYVLNAPFASRQGVDSEKFSNLLESMMSLQIREYVDDDPASLAPYGLDRPGRLYMESPDETLDILYGKREYGLRYAMLPGDNAVFTIEGLEPLTEAQPFTLMDKFAYIFNIDNVESFTVSGDGRTLEAAIQGKGDEAVFHLNGRKTADKEFRTFYQAVIGLLIDAEYRGPEARGEGSDWVVDYRLITPPGGRATLRLIPYNRDFYILEKEGIREFLIARTQARRIFETADAMVYAD